MRRLVGLAIVAAGIIAVVCGIIAVVAVQRYESPGPLADETTVIIPRGAGLDSIATVLAEAGVIEDRLLFKLGVRVLGAARQMKAGEYAFPAAISMRDIVDMLTSGRVVLHRLTVPEGHTSSEIVALLTSTEALAGAIETVPPEGSLLPETYHFVRDDTRAAVLQRMSQQMSDLLAELWKERAEDLPLKTPREAVILASIVEKETGVGSERPLVAGVFINRLRKGMQLQSDPTVVYGITKGKAPLGRRLLRRDLEKPSAYNTYTIYGLPPGPIANPGRASLEAVLQPAETDYLYFVADGSGGHAFAKTLRGHNRNVANWRKVQRQRKINETQ